MNLYLVRWPDGTISVISSDQERLYEVLKEEHHRPEAADIRKLPKDFKSLTTSVGPSRSIEVGVNTWTIQVATNGYRILADYLPQVAFPPSAATQLEEV